MILSSFPSDLRNYSQPAILYMQGFELVAAAIPGEMFFFFPGLLQNAEATQVLTNISPIPTTSVKAYYDGKNLSFGFLNLNILEILKELFLRNLTV